MLSGPVQSACHTLGVLRKGGTSASCSGKEHGYRGCLSPLQAVLARRHAHTRACRRAPAPWVHALHCRYWVRSASSIPGKHPRYVGAREMMFLSQISRPITCQPADLQHYGAGEVDVVGDSTCCARRHPCIPAKLATVRVGCRATGVDLAEKGRYGGECSKNRANRVK